MVPGKEREGEGGGDGPKTYRMAFPTKEGPRHFQVEGCSVRVATRTTTRVHLWHWHVQDTAVILEEGKYPPPTVTPVRHVGDVAVLEWITQEHIILQEGGGA